MLSEHELTFTPDYRFFVVRDQDCDAAEGGSDALEQAEHTVAATTPYELYVLAAQDLLRVRALLQVWNGQPPPVAPPWTTALDDLLRCPSGIAQMGDVTGNAIGGIGLDAGPGVYRVRLSHCGREQAVAELQRLDPHAATLPLEQLTAVYEPLAGIEQYLVQLSYHGPLPPDEDDDDED
jgi:hypothetical protein